MDDVRSLSSSVALGCHRLVDLQTRDGSWEAEMVWSAVITAQAVIIQTAVGRQPQGERRIRLLQYLRQEHRRDGGWGLHPESKSYVFVTTLAYVAARLLGAQRDDPMLTAARGFLAGQPGGVLANPQWGRFWLALLGLYRWEDLNPCPPELFLLPRRSNLSPLRFYCHTRYIYLVMAYLSGRRPTVPLGPLRDSLREELPGLSAPSGSARSVPVAASDLYEAPGPLLEATYALTRVVGPIWKAMPGASALRRHALDGALKRIRYDQRHSGYQSLSPVSGLLNTLALHVQDAADPDIEKSLAGAEYWAWDDAEEGLRYAGARSMAWDTSFALQALMMAPTGVVHSYRARIRSGYARLCAMQVRDELPDREDQDRDISRGGWCFTEGIHVWPVSDCTAEAVLALLDCQALPDLIPSAERIAPARLAEAATFILSRQNADGGFGSYERRRGATFLDTLNPSEMFGRCMTERTYVECTASSIRALRKILDADAPVDCGKLEQVITQGISVILSNQKPDGSWPGFWGINIIYGTLFALTALRDVGLSTDHPAFQRAQEWLESRQKPDGGWGEHFEGCATGQYVEHSHSLVITTSWAVLALSCTTDVLTKCLSKGAAWLIRHQGPDGDWPRDSVNGVFFGTAMLDYKLYNTYFPIMALAQADRLNNA